jgi:hypothetical protein
MMKKSVVAIMAAIVACMAGTAAADVVCPDSSYVVVTFNTSFTGTWNNGSDYDYVTIAPNGLGETFVNASGLNLAPPDIDIRVYVKNCNGDPLVGIPAQEIVLYNSSLCICPGGNASDAGGTDINGCATFTGSIAGGGCGQGLDAYVDGVPLTRVSVNGGAIQGGGAPVNINSTDTGLASPCFTDSSDLTAFAAVLGNVPMYTICLDFNETGAIDSSDLAFFSGVLGAACQ